MSATVTRLEPVEIGVAFRHDPDEILELAKGGDFTTLCIIGQLEDGAIWVSGNANTGAALVLMERAKHHLVFGEDQP